VGLTPHRNKRLQEFSKGMLQRIGLAQALIHEPELIFLDEPTSGLDPMGRRLVRDILRAQRERGATVFLNSHILSEIEITCDEVVFIRDGEVVTRRDLRTPDAEEVRVVVRARKLTPEVVSGLAQWTTSAVIEEEQLTITSRSQDLLPDILRHLVAAGVDVYQFSPQRLSLEDLFMKIMGEDRGL
jgi:ABC-2 type transport system ATP-binding protein